MDINARLQALYARLGHLAHNIGEAQREHAKITAEVEVLNRLSVEIAAAQKEAAHAPAPSAPSDTSADPAAAAG